MNVDMEELKGVFFEEAADQLAEMESNLLSLDAGADPELLNSIFRCAHSIKGGSGTFGMTDVTSFTHALETLLDFVRKGQIEVTTALTDLLLRSVDRLASLLAIARGESAEAVGFEAVLEEINCIIEEQSVGASDAFDEDAFRAEIEAMLAAAAAEDESAVPEPASEAVEPLADEDDFFAGVPPAPVVALQIDEVVQKHIAPVPDVVVPVPTPQRRRSDNPKTDSHVLRIPTEKVDKLINLVGELVIHQSMLNDIAANFTPDKAPQLAAAVTEVARATRELQERVMAVRMLPIKQAFARFSRLVHDLSAACGKSVELHTSGEETELDKTLIEGIADPLTHLVRNSIDHGIETPAERIAAGKPELGRVSLTACHEGGNIIIEVADDGRGLDRDRILKKAIENGLVDPNDSMTDDAIYNLVYKPGFSTAQQVTDISGRGVGMDIVVSSIRALGGNVTLTSVPGQGTTFRVRLPLTMAILEGLTIQVGREVYILPLTSILESIQPRAEDIHVLAGRGEIVTLRSESLAVVRLHELFDVPDAITDCASGLLVIIENDGRKAALLVDELVGQNQVVVKSLESNYGKIEGIAGATILGNGQVGLILDVASLISGTHHSRGSFARAA